VRSLHPNGRSKTVKTMRLFCLTFGDESCASTHFRLLQYQQVFSERGVQLQWRPAREISDFKFLSEFDCVVLQKALLPIDALKTIRRYSRRLVFDLDDLIWLHPHKTRGFFANIRAEYRLRFLSKEADLCTCPNRVIAAEMQRRGATVELIPMALDATVWKKPAVRNGLPICTVGWTGAPNNLSFLEAILPDLIEVQQKQPAVRYLIHSGVRPALKGLSFEYVPFVQGGEASVVERFDIGLLPLTQNSFTSGKSPIKALQYCASGAVVVGNLFGASAELIQDGVSGVHVGQNRSWGDALSGLVNSSDSRLCLARRARKQFEERHTLEGLAQSLLETFAPGAG
jgi:glycosyltransferase involved in cell wall biosynthesis